MSIKKNTPYDKFEVKILMDYDFVYPNNKIYPTIQSLLEGISRYDIIKYVQELNNEYQNMFIGDVQRFLLLDDISLINEFNKQLQRKRKLNNKYIIITHQTLLELLRFAFSIKQKLSKYHKNEIKERVLKAILLINTKLNHYETDVKSNYRGGSIYELILLSTFSQTGLDPSESKLYFLNSLTKCNDFLDYACKDDYFKPIYQAFTEKIGIKNYNEYIVVFLVLYGIIFEGLEGKNDQVKNKTIVVEDIKNYDRNILDFLSFDINTNIALRNNVDYTYFRNKPLIKVAENEYVFTNIIILFERLFNSLYFDFRKISKEMNLHGFDMHYKESFLEETLLRKYIEKINIDNRYVELSGIKLEKIKQNSAPDYYLRNTKNNSVILFEHKDIRIAANIKQSRDSQKIVEEYKNKLYSVIKNQGKKQKPKSKGIGQLINHIEMIQNGSFVWDKSINHNAIIYPVLVLTDINVIPKGLAAIMRDLFYNDLSQKKLVSKDIKPPIIIEISTFLIFSEKFKNKGLEYYFEEYYSLYDNKTRLNPLLYFVNTSLSFTDYMNEVYSDENTDLLLKEYTSGLINEFKQLQTIAL